MPETSETLEPAGVTPSRREPLMLLCHRIPYPPNKGDKIRAWHLLRYLAETYDVYLGTFVDDPQDWVHVPTLNNVCAQVNALSLNPLSARICSLSGFFTGSALSIPYYRSRQLQAWVADVSRRHQISRFVVFSSVMGQFLPPQSAEGNVVVDFVDVDSDKWRQYAETVNAPLSWVYRREARTLLEHDVALANAASHSLFVSPAEARFFADLPGVPDERVGYYANGVDAQYFDPHAYPETGERLELVFTGAMDYWPNIDAVLWFAENVFPALRDVYPSLRFTVVGGKPDARVQQLAKKEGVEVTGRVPDVRPFIARATAAIAPMRVARGVQNKVLEGMAMARPVITSAMGLEGINAIDGEEVLIAESSDDYLGALAKVLSDDGQSIGARARALVLRDYAWESTLQAMGDFLKADPQANAVAHV